jgi:hypothetical protein
MPSSVRNVEGNLMSLFANLMGAASAKAVAGLAGASLAVGGAASIVDVTDPAPEIESVVEAEEEIEEVEVQEEHEDDGPDDNAAQVAKDIHDYKSTTDDTGCRFGLTIASIARGDDAPPEEFPCENAGEEGEENGEAGRAMGAERSAAGRARAAEARGNAPDDVPAGGEDAAPFDSDENPGDDAPPSDG